MENAADALKMAAAILIFIVAIGASFSLFGTAKQTADSIIGMRDKQAYLEAAELDNGVLYTSSDAITSGSMTGLTTNGDRIVNISDVVSTIYRYSKEKYGVTIVKYSATGKGQVLARFDSSTESLMRQYNNIESGLDEYKEKLEINTANAYTTPRFTGTKLEELYRIDVEGDNDNIKYGAPWFGNDNEINKRINIELYGGTYTYNNETYVREDDGLIKILNNASQIIEVTNEIDKSDYLKDNGQDTNLLQQYNMPIVEIIYIVYD